MRHCRFLPITAVLVVMCAAHAHAQNWPSKPIRMLVPYPAGGTSDILARMVGPKMTDRKSTRLNSSH